MSPPNLVRSRVVKVEANGAHLELLFEELFPLGGWGVPQRGILLQNNPVKETKG